jgi:ubiquinone/menaquinone biosynthesis C-methylase UbiE
MELNSKTKVCPVELSGTLDNFIRRAIHRPEKILKKYIRENMTVLDFGCGPGFFTIPLADWVGPGGKVIAADLQSGMLDLVKLKTGNKESGKRIEYHQCAPDRIGFRGAVDFVLAFYMIHELPDENNAFREIKSILKPQGRMLVVEPLFHVSKNEFEKMVHDLVKSGYKPIERPHIFMSRAILLCNNDGG